MIFTWDYNPTAALFPRWVALASMAFLAGSLGRRFFGAQKPRAEEYDEEFPQPGPGALPWPAVLLLQTAYILAIYVVGFTVATLLYLIAGPIQMHYRRWAVITGQAIFLTGIVAGSIILFFHIRLPSGMLWNLW